MLHFIHSTLAMAKVVVYITGSFVIINLNDQIIFTKYPLKVKNEFLLFHLDLITRIRRWIFLYFGLGFNIVQSAKDLVLMEAIRDYLNNLASLTCVATALT